MPLGIAIAFLRHFLFDPARIRVDRAFTQFVSSLRSYRLFLYCIRIGMEP